MMHPASRSRGVAFCVFMALICGGVEQVAAQNSAEAVLPDGVKAVWSLPKAYRESTPTRERICINGLWQWQPAADEVGAVPEGGWGYFKVPGEWPQAYNRGGSQTLYPHPSWAGQDPGAVNAAWYQREITIPPEWAGRRITLYTEYLNSLATVHVDGQNVGEVRFPWGEVDLTSACRPGQTQVLSLYVQALPLRAVTLAFGDTATPRQVRGRVDRRGLCGDVYLVSTPQGARIGDVKVETSVRNWQITFNTALDGLTAGGQYYLRARVKDGAQEVAQFASQPFGAGDLKGGRIAFTADWKPEKLWDTVTPQNQYDVGLALTDAGGKVLDESLPARFGFREFWIDGRDFYLNGTRIYLSALPVDNAQMGAAQANYRAVRETLERFQAFGINFVYTHNYGCEPGSHLSFAEELRAADDVGMLLAISQPQFGHYDWDAPDADKTNGYAQHAEFYVRMAQNHPSVVFYATSHNATGYSEGMNPDLIDGIHGNNDLSPNAGPGRALRAQAIINKLDPTRVVYHHSSGNLGTMHTENFYANFAPIQEISDWLEHWATVGVKPFFTCEYSVPWTWDWSMYRGWYKGKRSFGSAAVPWEFCVAEWDAEFYGPAAYKISEPEKANLRWEAQKFRAGQLWQRWDYPYSLGSREFDERYPVMATYITDNWRAFRTWGMSANSPWEQWHYWKPRPGVQKGRKDFQVDWENLQRPGFSPDYAEPRDEYRELAYERSDWIATPAAEALLRNNMPLLAYIGGKPAAFTSKDHNFLPGETVEKQLIVINNSRVTMACDCQWSFALPAALTGSKTVTLPTGQQERIPLTFQLPADLAPGQYSIDATVKFSSGETQVDSFLIDVLPKPDPIRAAGRIALFDPKGETAALLKGLGIPVEPVGADAALAGYDVLLVGKGALTLDAPAPDVSRVRDGLKVVVFEQAGDVLEKRFGFRVAERGMRWAFKRVPDHPLLAGIAEEQLWNWRGEATILPPRGTYEMTYHSPMSKWCDITVTRIWRCGNRGNVASAVIEKPACGDFLPILDCGYALQFTPLMEYREGAGMVLFCQTDVTGRTESDSAADALARNILRYVSTWKPAARRTVVYAGDPAGKKQLESAGLTPGGYSGGNLPADRVLVVGPGGGQELASNAAAVAEFVKAGGDVLAVGLDQQEANAFLPLKVTMKAAEHIAAYFEPFGADSLLAGVSPADVHNRDPRELPLVSGGATAFGDGVLGKAVDSNVVFCQLAPWQLDYSGEKMNIKRTFRKASYTLTRVLANMGAAGQTPLLERLSSPVAQGEQRWMTGFYLDVPEEWDEPYRFFRW